MRRLPPLPVLCLLPISLLAIACGDGAVLNLADNVEFLSDGGHAANDNTAPPIVDDPIIDPCDNDPSAPGCGDPPDDCSDATYAESHSAECCQPGSSDPSCSTTPSSCDPIPCTGAADCREAAEQLGAARPGLSTCRQDVCGFGLAGLDPDPACP